MNKSFTCPAARKVEFPDLDSTNYAASVQKLRDEFISRFPKFRRDEIKVKMFAHPFDLAVDDRPDDCQMEADMDTKRGYSENSLADFYKLFACGKMPSLPGHARYMTSLFGSTNCCEQFF